MHRFYSLADCRLLHATDCCPEPRATHLPKRGRVGRMGRAADEISERPGRDLALRAPCRALCLDRARPDRSENRRPAF